MCLQATVPLQSKALMTAVCGGHTSLGSYTLADVGESAGRAFEHMCPLLAYSACQQFGSTLRQVHVLLHLQVSYFYDPECCAQENGVYGPTAVYYGHRHPMKPHRIAMTHSLLMNSAYWPSLRVRALPSLCCHALEQNASALACACLPCQCVVSVAHHATKHMSTRTTCLSGLAHCAQAHHLHAAQHELMAQCNVQMKQARPVKEEVIKQFCSDGYYNFLSRPRTAAQWDSLERVVREGNADVHPEASDLECYGIMVRLPSQHAYNCSKVRLKRTFGAQGAKWIAPGAGLDNLPCSCSVHISCAAYTSTLAAA